MPVVESSLESRARRIARKNGLIARKSRARRGSCDNLGGFMLLEPRRNAVIAGSRFDMSAEDVIGYFAD